MVIFGHIVKTVAVIVTGFSQPYIIVVAFEIQGYLLGPRPVNVSIYREFGYDTFAMPHGDKIYRALIFSIVQAFLRRRHRNLVSGNSNSPAYRFYHGKIIHAFRLNRYGNGFTGLHPID